MRTVIAFILVWFLSLGSFAQEPTSHSIKTSATEHINRLRQGVLIVRLPTKSKTIQLLRESERHKQADMIELKLRNENLELAKAFESSFDFCPVYFIYSHDSKHISAWNPDSITFLNYDLNPIEELNLEEKPIYTAELGLIQQNTSSARESMSNTEKKDIDNRNEAKYHGGTDMRFHALIIKDQNFQQLSRPFPYYARTLDSFFLRREKSDVVRKMNEKLNKFITR